MYRANVRMYRDGECIQEGGIGASNVSGREDVLQTGVFKQHHKLDEVVLNNIFKIKILTNFRN